MPKIMNYAWVSLGNEVRVFGVNITDLVAKRSYFIIENKYYLVEMVQIIG